MLGAERFVVEIKTTAALQHLHILPLFDSGTADGFLYYVMRFIDGETLRDKLNRETQLGVEDAVKIETPVYDLHRSPIDGTAAETLFVSNKDKMAMAVSPDGQTLAYMEAAARERLLFAPVAGGASTPFDPRESSQRAADFSPDGRWVVYDEVGANLRSEVYVRAIDGQGGRRQVSSDGGDQPRWTRGGREIVYRKGDAMLAASFDPATREVGVPALLFAKKDAGRLGGGRTVGYDVTPDGSRFLLVTPVERETAQPTVVVINWLEELKRKLPR